MGCVRSVPLDGPRGPSARREGFARIVADANVVRLKLGRIGLGSSTPKAVPARAKGRCEMMPDPTPPYRAPDFCPGCRACWRGGGEGLTAPGSRLKSN